VPMVRPRLVLHLDEADCRGEGAHMAHGALSWHATLNHIHTHVRHSVFVAGSDWPRSSTRALLLRLAVLLLCVLPCVHTASLRATKA
jgi:hypothetical protein